MDITNYLFDNNFTIKLIEQVNKFPELWMEPNQEKPWPKEILRQIKFNLLLGDAVSEKIDLIRLWKSIQFTYFQNRPYFYYGKHEIEFSEEMKTKLKFLDFYRLNLLDIDGTITLLTIMKMYPVFWTAKHFYYKITAFTWNNILIEFKQTHMDTGVTVEILRDTWYFLRDRYIEEVLLENENLFPPIFKSHMKYLEEKGQSVKAYVNENIKNTDIKTFVELDLPKVLNNVLFNVDDSFKKFQISESNKVSSFAPDYQAKTKLKKNKTAVGKKELKEKIVKSARINMYLRKKLKFCKNASNRKNLKRRSISNYFMSMADIVDSLPKELVPEIQKQISTLMEFEENEYKLRTFKV